MFKKPNLIKALTVVCFNLFSFSVIKYTLSKLFFFLFSFSSILARIFDKHFVILFYKFFY